MSTGFLNRIKQQHNVQTPEQPLRLAYVLSAGSMSGLILQLAVGRHHADGRLEWVQHYHLQVQHLTQAPGFFEACDKDLLSRLVHWSPGWAGKSRGDIPQQTTVSWLRQAVLSHRVYWQEAPGNETVQRINWGDSLPGFPVWRMDGEGTQTLGWQLSETVRVFEFDQPVYFNAAPTNLGLVESTLSPNAMHKIRNSVPLMPGGAPDALEAFLTMLSSEFLSLELPLPRKLTIHAVYPSPRLALLFDGTDAITAGLHLYFDYPTTGVEQWRVSRHESLQYRSTVEGDAVVCIHRNESEENRILEQFFRSLSVSPRHSATTLRWERPLEWQKVMTESVPACIEKGWSVQIAPDFYYHYVAVERYSVHLNSEGNQWFDLALGIEIAGETHDLMPLLQQVAARYTLTDLGKMQDEQEVEVCLMDGRRTFLQAKRVKQWLTALVELYDQTPMRHLRLSLQQLGRVLDLESKNNDDIDWQDRDALLAQAKRIVAEPEEIPALSKEFLATLRDYQLKGVAWLQHLRKLEQGGILADDMGLGKTVQTLAHIAIEQAAGRLEKPALVVVPTSLLSNWANEAQRWAPFLRVAVLHGNGRHEIFNSIEQYHVIFTTYALVINDLDKWQVQPLSLLILDEAQAIKNARTQAAMALKKIEADQRICLSGTPLENHLGELWSLFDFLMPGFLFGEKRFQRYFRYPIEKEADDVRARLLMKWVGPFMLRRRKDEVARELPPKTEIIVKIPLQESQRDLYESIRTKVLVDLQRDLPKQTAAEGRVFVLNALTQLRQLCCDPQLVSGHDVKNAPSAKRQRCIEMLQELVEEGRSILVFSQFTRMLDLLGQDLQAAGIPYLLLTGQTTARGEIVEKFQQGAAPVFLISLKAGGAGLNLTAADTVIHYDPWWNSAAEQQATDRAHRIGQEKPVFVYRLLTQDTVEEKINALQQSKRLLLESVYAAAEDTARQWVADTALLLSLLKNNDSIPTEPNDLQDQHSHVKPNKIRTSLAGSAIVKFRRL